ncbi:MULTISPECIES: amidohydrolase family protein [unclassified Cryobacterium]|uniref:amidohydrolase family protein n=1 Tax=unclassified Cryobacterium TaxID=2649013 RepID=UPI002AB5D596|nr:MULTISPECIES: amidohydrolase family protein [unclassified Cryobacterium]MDY7528905.1 amidohydrolase family protein [Cryobacterium sp. 10C2]MDY7558929.1 amidohydrolase family protein [Cryobacterium sp. 10C3]MEB0200714.1 amidohydrolase family protein [Cryobacterium sp. 5I3]MEB0291372.1 amidohydrolase family protein [Cryobacterium sp. 10C2]
MTTQTGTDYRAIVDTHRHPIGPKLQAKCAEAGLFDPSRTFPQNSGLDVVYREFVDLEYAMPKQREEGVTLSIASSGGEVAWIAHDLLMVSSKEALKFLNDEYLEIKGTYPGEFELMANADALDESCQPIVEDMIRQGGAKAIAVASSYGSGANRTYLDSPKAEWLWDFAEANNLVVHIHPPMLSVGNEVLAQYRLNEAVGRPFDSTVNVSRMIGSGVFDRHPNLQVMVVHMGGELPSIIGRLDFTWHLNYEGLTNPPAGAPYTNKLAPSTYFKTNILVDTMGFSSIALRAAVEAFGIDRVVFGTDYGAVPYGVKEHIEIVEDLVTDPAERDLVFWKTSNDVFRLGLDA